MDGVTDLGLFIVAGLLLNITPGPDLLYILSRGAGQGKKAGVVAALGIGAGCLVHILAATFGLSVILVSSSFLFNVVKYIGAAYLFYLGINTLLRLKDKAPQVQKSTVLPLGVIFRQAVLINVLNPKVALFFLALLPQFVSPAAEFPAAVFLFLGLVFNINGTFVNILFALFASTVGERIQATVFVQRLLKSLAGALFLAFGIRLAFIS
jgi:threonine/homoserine/homoserine lactone efflux protein